MLKNDFAEANKYFEVVRLNIDPLSLLFHSTLKIYCRFLYEKKNIFASVDNASNLQWAFQKLILHLAKNMEDFNYGSPRFSHAFVSNHSSVIARWKFAHHMFFILIQGLIVSLKDFEYCIENEDLEKARRFLDLSTILLKGATIAMTYSEDISSEDYQKIIRPSMEKPNVSINLSGLMLSDHDYLIKVFRKLSNIFLKSSQILPDSYKNFIHALENIYEVHKNVCAKFVESQPSLRMGKNHKKTAIEVLDNLKNSRLKKFK